MDYNATIAELKVENEALGDLIVKRSAALYDVLSALSSMWNQYCPPPWTHQYMNAGEEAEEVLKEWQLLRTDATSVNIAGLMVDEDVPIKVRKLLTRPLAQDE